MADVQCVSANHGSTSYTDLMLRSLLAHHSDRADIGILILDNQSPDVSDLDWASRYGVHVRQSGRSIASTSGCNTHGEVLRDGVLSNTASDSILVVDSDVCFVSDNTITAMQKELASDARLFAVAAVTVTSDEYVRADAQSLDDGSPVQSNPSKTWRAVYGRRLVLSTYKGYPFERFSTPVEHTVDLGDNVPATCTLLRNDTVLQLSAEMLGFSPAYTQSDSGGVWWDTMGLVTQVMKTHGRTWRYSSERVVHFGHTSWDSERATLSAQQRDVLTAKYRREIP